jgi:hypothetical protein
VHANRHSCSKSADFRRLGWRAWFVAAMATIIAVAPVLGSLHRAFVHHVVCEHGDLIELPDEQQAMSGSAQADESGRAATIGQEAVASVHQHDHCAVGALARSAASAPAGERLFQRLLSQKCRFLTSESDRRCAQSILSLAPKTSPPVASLA